jgi:hypothetical protein
MRQIMDIAGRYYLLFWEDSKQVAVELYLQAFRKVVDAVKFSMTDEFLLFFKICTKLGANTL